MPKFVLNQPAADAFASLFDDRAVKPLDPIVAPVRASRTTLI